MSTPTQTLRNDKSFAAASLAGKNGAVPDPDAANRKNLLLLIQLRWLAVAGQVLDAVREERFWVLTHPELDNAIRTRVDDILERRNPAAQFFMG